MPQWRARWYYVLSELDLVDVTEEDQLPEVYHGDCVPGRTMRGKYNAG